MHVERLEAWRSRWRPRLQVHTWESLAEQLDEVSKMEEIAEGPLGGSPDTCSSGPAAGLETAWRQEGNLWSVLSWTPKEIRVSERRQWSVLLNISETQSICGLRIGCW